MNVYLFNLFMARGKVPAWRDIEQLSTNCRAANCLDFLRDETLLCSPPVFFPHHRKYVNLIVVMRATI